MFCYIPWWMTSPVTSDLQLINSIHDHSILAAGAVTDAVRRLAWYLTEEMVVLSLFNNHVFLDPKQGMADMR